jgi:hypothetical protein
MDRAGFVFSVSSLLADTLKLLLRGLNSLGLIIQMLKKPGLSGHLMA